MTLCKDCKHFTPTVEERGTCFGVEVFADSAAENCLIKAFEPKHEPAEE